jgi:hypothetical protein
MRWPSSDIFRQIRVKIDDGELDSADWSSVPAGEYMIPAVYSRIAPLQSEEVNIDNTHELRPAFFCVALSPHPGLYPIPSSLWQPCITRSFNLRTSAAGTRIRAAISSLIDRDYFPPYFKRQLPRLAFLAVKLEHNLLHVVPARVAAVAYTPSFDCARAASHPASHERARLSSMLVELQVTSTLYADSTHAALGSAALIVGVGAVLIVCMSSKPGGIEACRVDFHRFDSRQRWSRGGQHGHHAFTETQRNLEAEARQKTAGVMLSQMIYSS